MSLGNTLWDKSLCPLISPWSLCLTPLVWVAGHSLLCDLARSTRFARSRANPEPVEGVGISRSVCACVFVLVRKSKIESQKSAKSQISNFQCPMKSQFQNPNEVHLCLTASICVNRRLNCAVWNNATRTCNSQLPTRGNALIVGGWMFVEC